MKKVLFFTLLCVPFLLSAADLDHWDCWHTTKKWPGFGPTKVADDLCREIDSKTCRLQDFSDCYRKTIKELYSNHSYRSDKNWQEPQDKAIEACRETLKCQDKNVVKEIEDCRAPYMKAVTDLRNAQLSMTPPDSKETLGELKDAHDKAMAKLIVLKGIHDIREEYLSLKKKAHKTAEKTIDEIQDLQKYVREKQDDLFKVEKTYLIERILAEAEEKKGSATDNIKDIMVEKCAGATNGKPEYNRLCKILSRPEHKAMLDGFYEASYRSKLDRKEMKAYRAYLELALDSAMAEKELSVREKFQSELALYHKKFLLCENANPKIPDCFPSKEKMNASFKEYMEKLDPLVGIFDSKKLKESKSKIEDQFKTLTQKLEATENFLTASKDPKKLPSLDGTNKYANFIADFSQFVKTTPNTQKAVEQIPELLEKMGCKKEMELQNKNFSEKNFEDFAECINGVSEKVLEDQINELNKEVDKKRSLISKVTTAPTFSFFAKKRVEMNQKYTDYTDSIQRILKAMDEKCGNAIGRSEDAPPPADCKNLQSLPGTGNFENLINASGQIILQVEKKPDASKKDEPATTTTELCDRMKKYNVPEETLKEVCKPPKEEKKNDPSPSGKPPVAALKAKESTATRVQGRSGDTVRAIGVAAVNSPYFMGFLQSAATMPAFKAQMEYQTLATRQQMEAEAYQRAWYSYYAQMQSQYWMNFMNTQQSMYPQNGGLYYNTSGFLLTNPTY